MTVKLVATASVGQTDEETVCVRFDGIDLSNGKGLRLLEALYERLTLHPEFKSLGSDAHQVNVCHFGGLRPSLVAKLVRTTAKSLGVAVATSMVA